MKPSSHTPYSDVNEILDLLYQEVSKILQDQIIGMYLHGSLANGGFDQHSDIDVIFATQAELPEQTFAALQEMHKKLAEIDSRWAMQLEVAYLPQDALRQSDPPDIRYPHLDRGRGEVLHKIRPESDWYILRHILRERGILIAGPDPKNFIDPVSPDELRKGVVEGLPLWLPPILKNPSEISKRGYQSFFVLSLCRMLYTLKYGKIVPKQFAAEWGLANLGPNWKPLIERALLGRQHPDLDAQPEDIQGTLNMMRFTLEQSQPTLYLDVNEVLHLLLAGVKEILGEQFVGLYLYGSLSSGDFNPETSDIDFLVVTKDSLPDETIRELEAMHNRTWATTPKRAGKLEGSYVPMALIRCHDPNGAACPTVNEGRFYVAPLGSDWIIQRHVVREMGVVIEGPDPKSLIDFVTPEDIRRSVLATLHEWWFPMLDDPTWLREHESGYRSFAVLTMCRVLHALEQGTIVPKLKASRWAREKLGDRWKPLIDNAVAVSNHENQDVTLEDTLNFIRFVKSTVESGRPQPEHSEGNRDA